MCIRYDGGLGCCPVGGVLYKPQSLCSVRCPGSSGWAETPCPLQEQQAYPPTTGFHRWDTHTRTLCEIRYNLFVVVITSWLFPRPSPSCPPGGDAKLLVMLCVSPTQHFITESLQSLGFGTRARQVQRVPPRKKSNSLKVKWRGTNSNLIHCGCRGNVSSA